MDIESGLGGPVLIPVPFYHYINRCTGKYIPTALSRIKSPKHPRNCKLYFYFASTWQHEHFQFHTMASPHLTIRILKKW